MKGYRRVKDYELLQKGDKWEQGGQVGEVDEHDYGMACRVFSDNYIKAWRRARTGGGAPPGMRWADPGERVWHEGGFRVSESSCAGKTHYMPYPEDPRLGEEGD